MRQHAGLINHGTTWQSSPSQCCTFCLRTQVAEAAEDRSHSTEAAGQHEAALYAALASHVHKILPVCQTRADILWAYTRSWLALQVNISRACSETQEQLVSNSCTACCLSHCVHKILSACQTRADALLAYTRSWLALQVIIRPAYYHAQNNLPQPVHVHKSLPVPD